LQFSAAVHTSEVNCNEMAAYRFRPKQCANWNC